MKAIIIGTGCAGFNCADWLFDLGNTDILILTKGINKGTSRNTGSDKQTYYKLSLSGFDNDSVGEMANTLFSGGAVNGDLALVEASCSVKSFMKLVNLGIPFPTNIYGEYVGYKTDHDPRQRATSCGPLTSKIMTETLEKSVVKKGISIRDNIQVVDLLVENNEVYGVYAFNTKTFEYETFYCDNVVLATGSPSTIYKYSVYPHSQTGAIGLARKSGLKFCNLQEWQYGLASIKFRWNVSGTYQQVIPKYISVDKNGVEKEFLLEHFSKPELAYDLVFLKGYQWPFDTKKIDGSSKIDLLVYEEIQKGNKVFMDFRENPSFFDFDKLGKESYDYLKNSNALLETPIKRLEKMNSKAIQLYNDNGIDLYNEMLEISVCSQHMNGGIDVDINFETSIKSLYAIGETAGTFGIYRPGGTALNSTQVGSMRVAEHITYKKVEKKQDVKFSTNYNIELSETSNLLKIRKKYQEKMSLCASFIRDIEEMKNLKNELINLKDHFPTLVKIASKNELSSYHQLFDDTLAQISILSAMILSAETCGNRGSAFVKNSNIFNEKTDSLIITQNEISHFEKVRPIPKPENWFEKVWAEFDERQQK